MAFVAIIPDLSHLWWESFFFLQNFTVGQFAFDAPNEKKLPFLARSIRTHNILQIPNKSNIVFWHFDTDKCRRVYQVAYNDVARVLLTVSTLVWNVNKKFSNFTISNVYVSWCDNLLIRPMYKHAGTANVKHGSINLCKNIFHGKYLIRVLYKRRQKHNFSTSEGINTTIWIIVVITLPKPIGSTIRWIAFFFSPGFSNFFRIDYKKKLGNINFSLFVSNSALIWIDGCAWKHQMWWIF